MVVVTYDVTATRESRRVSVDAGYRYARGQIHVHMELVLEPTGRHQHLTREPVELIFAFCLYPRPTRE